MFLSAQLVSLPPTIAATAAPTTFGRHIHNPATPFCTTFSWRSATFQIFEYQFGSGDNFSLLRVYYSGDHRYRDFNLSTRERGENHFEKVSLGLELCVQRQKRQLETSTSGANHLQRVPATCKCQAP